MEAKLSSEALALWKPHDSNGTDTSTLPMSIRDTFKKDEGKGELEARITSFMEESVTSLQNASEGTIAEFATDIISVVRGILQNTSSAGTSGFPEKMIEEAVAFCKENEVELAEDLLFLFDDFAEQIKLPPENAANVRTQLQDRLSRGPSLRSLPVGNSEPGLVSPQGAGRNVTTLGGQVHPLGDPLALQSLQKTTGQIVNVSSPIP
eukprot:6565310-Prymnesium_polylepis.1